MYTFFIILIYLIVLVIKEKKIPYSISETRYYLDNPIWFTVIMVFISYNLLPLIVSVTPENYQIFAFLSMIGISFVGVADDFRRDESVDMIHTVFAIISFICSQIWIGLLIPKLLLIWIPLLIYLIVKFIKYRSINKIFEYTSIKFWAELIAIMSIYLALLFLL